MLQCELCWWLGQFLTELVTLYHSLMLVIFYLWIFFFWIKSSVRSETDFSSQQTHNPTTTYMMAMLMLTT